MCVWPTWVFHDKVKDDPQENERDTMRGKDEKMEKCGGKRKELEEIDI